MWLALAMTSALGTALWTALSKRIVQSVPPLRMMMLFQATTAVILLGPFLALGRLPARGDFWIAVGVIGILQAAMWVVVMYGFERDYLATYGMFDTSPLFTMVLEIVFLREHFELFVWGGVMAIVLGAIVFYRSAHVSLYGIAGAVMAAIVNVLAKHTLNQVEPLVFLFLMVTWGGFMLTVTYLFVEHREVHKPRWGLEVREVAPLAVIYAAALVMFYLALYLDTATRVSAVTRISLVFGFVLSYFLLRETRDWRWRVVGTVLIVAGTVAVSL